VHAVDKAIGYELSGNSALFKGDLKLVLNLPPAGDGQWHLYDIRNDPGETRDLQHELATEFATMQADYAAWAEAHGVLPMPAGYEPTRQVMLNALLDVYVPRYRPLALALLAAALLLGGVIVLSRRRPRRA
jgi:hypothetical protein